MELRNMSVGWYIAGGCLVVAVLRLLALAAEDEMKRDVGTRVFSNVPIRVGEAAEEVGGPDGRPFHEVTKP